MKISALFSRAKTAFLRIPLWVRWTVCAVLVLAAGLVAAAFLGKPVETVPFSENRFAVLEDAQEGVTRLYHGRDLLAVANGRIKQNSTSLTGAETIVLTDAGELYHLSLNKAVLLHDEVMDVRLASEGGVIAYVTKSGALYRYDTVRWEGEQLDEYYGIASLDYLAVSPNGKAIVYAKKTTEGEIVLCLNGTAGAEELSFAHIDMTCRPIAVSDDAAYLYYLTDTDHALYFASIDGTCRKITASLCTDRQPVRFNRFLTEVLFCEVNGYTYFSFAGKEKEKVSSGLAEPLLSASEGAFVTRNTEVLSIPTVRERLYLLRKDEVQSLHRMKENFDGVRLSADVSEAFLSSDEQDVYVVRAEADRYRLYHIDVGAREPKETLVASGVTFYQISHDAESIYYIARSRIYCRTADADTLLYDNASEVFLSPSGEVYCSMIREDGLRLVFSLNKKEPVSIVNDVDGVLVTQENLYFTAQKEGKQALFFAEGNAVTELKRAIES